MKGKKPRANGRRPGRWSAQAETAAEVHVEAGAMVFQSKVAKKNGMGRSVLRKRGTKRRVAAAAVRRVITWYPVLFYAAVP